MGFNFGGLFGGGDEEEAPSLTDIFQEYPDILQMLMDTSNRFAPQQAELQANLQEQYMPRLMQSQQDALMQVSPEAAGLTELLAQQAKEGMTGELTDSERRQFLDMQKSLVGEQAMSGIGTDYIGSKLLDYINGRKQGAQQLGLQTRSLLPSLSLQTPSYMDYSQQFSPSQFLSGENVNAQLNSQLTSPSIIESLSGMLPQILTVAGTAFGGPVGGVAGNAAGQMASSSFSQRQSPSYSNIGTQTQNPYYYPINADVIYGKGGRI